MRSTAGRVRNGDYLVIDDRTGFRRWRSECVKDWQGLIVHRSVYEPRHPQDFLRARRDDFRIPDARPQRRIEDENFQGPRITEFAVDAPAGSLGVAVNSIRGFNDGDYIRLYLDNGDLFQTQIVHAPIRIDNSAISMDILSILIDCDATIEIASPLPLSASIGNLVIDITNQF